MWKIRVKPVLALLLGIAIAVPTGLGAGQAAAAAVGDTVMSAGFDTGTDGWFKRGTETVAQSTAAAQSGAGSLLATGRSAMWNGPGVNANALVPGATYDFSIYAKLKEDTPVGSATVELTINQQGLPQGDAGAYAKIDAKPVTAADWVPLQGRLTVDARASGYQVYVQSTDSATVDYYVDTFAVKLVSLPVGEPAPSAKIPVVLYHKVNAIAESGNDYQTTLDLFKKQMKYLSDNGYTTLSAQQYEEMIRGDLAPPERPVLLTFDDGTPDFYSNAWPVLKQYGMKATLFIVADWIGEGKYGMTNAQLAALAADSNLDLENHTKTHGDLTKMDKAAAQADIAAGGAFLESLTGEKPRMLAYPNGAYNADVAQAAAAEGIELAFKVGDGITRPSDDKLALGREMVLAGDTLATFAAKIGGPTPPAEPGPVSGTVVLSQSFEDGQQGGWENLSWGGTGTIGVSADTASDGTHALKFSGRGSRASSPTLNLTSLMQSGRTYDLSLKVKLGEGTDTLHLASKVASPLLDNQYPWLAGDREVSAEGWTTFEVKSFEVPANTSELRIWIESATGSTSVADFYIDEVVLKDVTPGEGEPGEGELDQSGVLADFEDGQGDWVRRFGDGNIAATDAVNHTEGGSRSLLTTVSQQYDGPLLDVMGKMHKGYKYNLSAWVRMAPGQSPTALRISVQSGDSAFTNVSANASVTADGWTQLSGTFTVATTPSVLRAYVEAADNIGGERSFYLDDFALAYVGPVAGPLPIQTDIDALKNVYADSFKIGAAVEPAQIEGDAKALVDFHYSSIVAENSTKPASLNPSEGVWNWTSADKIALYAKDHGLDFRLHTLAWHSQAAEWMFKDEAGQPLAATPENKTLVLNRLTTYIETVARHFKALGVQIQSVDVVNEVIDEGQPDGMRRSEWLRLTGTDFIKTAFTVARRELPDAKLYINDYNTHDPKKRDFLYSLATTLRAEGVPIDGVGHQTHINISGPSVQQISDSIRKFAEAGFDNQLTELDVSVYTNNSTSYEPIPEDILVKQGYRFKELFKELVRLDEAGKVAGNPEGWISNVTLWGVADDYTWLHNRGTTRQDAPFPFDKRHQAKYAYWGMIEAVKTLNPSKLPLTAKAANTAQGSPANAADQAWQTVPAMYTESLGTLDAEVKTLWDAQQLYVRVAVRDLTGTPTDQVELFVDDGRIRKLVFPRGHSSIVETADGYVLETAIPVDGALGKQVKFDVRVTDKGINDGTEQGGNGVIVSWSDPRSSQDGDSLGYGVLTYIEATRIGTALRGTPVIDGEPDGIWSAAPAYRTDVVVEQHGGAAAKAEFRTLWDAQYLYVYAVVTDAQLSDVIANAWEQDSLEIFVDQNNGKTAAYEDDDGQYRISYKNAKTVGGHARDDNYISATKLVEGGYAVEAAIALDTISPATGTLIGFDLQVNNDQDGGTRDSVFTWNDPTGQSYANTSRFGVLKLAETAGPKPDDGTNGPVTGTNPGTQTGADPIAVTTDAKGNATASVGAAAFAEALKDVKEGRIAFNVRMPAGTKSMAVQLPLAQVKSADEAGVREIRINTGLANFTLPLSLLEEAGLAGDVELSVSLKDAAALSGEVRGKIGERPIYDFTLRAAGTRIAAFGADRKVRVAIPYAQEPGIRPGQVVIYAVSDNGELEVIKNGRYDPAAGTVTFDASHFSLYAAAPVQVRFADERLAPWATDSILALAARGIVNGVNGRNGNDASGSSAVSEPNVSSVAAGASEVFFAPERAVTRAEFAQMLVRALDLKADDASAALPFADVKANDWYADAAAAAYQAGIVRGKGDGTFGGRDRISRQDMAVMTHRALLAAGADLGAAAQEAAAFADEDAIANYAREAIAALRRTGVASGMPDGSFAPGGTCTRAQAAVMLERVLLLQLR
ncbi:endo-1,4-beta-xylanase [Cohnella sp. GCM10012308]|uniref:endo-1,4-beta-xylanase n=1 Tax=Cohnella sp. GCM10012308 TaxID=3317329 RepID=UPI0036110495